MSDNLKTVITYGTFDVFHIGHLRLLERARALGDRLVVGVSSDEFNKIKGKQSIFPYAHRAEIVLATKYVDAVFPEHSWDQKPDDIKKYGAHIFVMGHDWQGKFDGVVKGCDVVYLPRTEGISSTEVKQAIGLWQRGSLAEINGDRGVLEAIFSQLKQ